MACDPKCEDCFYVLWRPEPDIEYEFISIMCNSCRDETDGPLPSDDTLLREGMLNVWRQYHIEYRWKKK